MYIMRLVLSLGACSEKALVTEREERELELSLGMGLMFSILCACSTVNVFIKDLKKRDGQYTGLHSTACACYEQHYLEISFSYGRSLVATILN